MKKTWLVVALVAMTLAGCVVVPARPVVVRAPVFVY
jgi:outer membrane lipoprotein SlyB